MGNVAAIPLIQPGCLSPERGPTEESLAREWVAIHGENWRFDHTVHKWFHWDGQRWARDNCRLVGYLIAEHLRAAGTATKSPGIASAKTARGMETFASAHPNIALTNERWDADPWLLGTPAGTVDLRTGHIHSAKPDVHITKLVAVAPGEGDPALWLRFLSEAVAGDAEMIGFLQRWCGYCLTGSTQEHAFAFIHGPGGNGKSVFLNAIAGILGEYAATAAMETFAEARNDRHSTELAMLKGARLVTASETEQGRGCADQDRQVDRRNHQAIRCRKGLRGAPAPLGRRTNLGMAQSQPPSRQELRADHRLGNSMALHRFHPALHQTHRKTLPSLRIIMNQTLKDARFT